MTTLIVIIFCLGYALIALENITKVNKAAVALMMCVFTWGLFALGGFAGEFYDAAFRDNSRRRKDS